MDRAGRWSPWVGLTVVGLLLTPKLLLADPITVPSAPIRGQFPLMITAFANEAGTDVLPAGATDFYVFTYFDTGATRVFFDVDTAATLGVTNGMVTDVRLNGLRAIDPATLLAPIYSGFQAEVQDVPVRVPGADITLIGGPVANAVEAVIDYTTLVTRGPYAFLGGDVTGPDITFYGAGADVGYTPSIELSMQPFGTTGPGLGQRYWMYDIGFYDGAFGVASPAGGDMTGTSTRFLYDTGTNVTLLTDTLGTSLGLTGPPDFIQSVSGVDRPGYYLDSITMNGAGGLYTVLNAPVVVTTDPLGGSADAIIGSNLFDSTQLLFDGPGARLGIGVAGVPPDGSAPEPSTLWLAGGGLAAALARRRRSAGRR